MRTPIEAWEDVWRALWLHLREGFQDRTLLPSDDEARAYRSLLPLNRYFSTDEAIPRFHYVVPNCRALEIAERYGLKATGPVADCNVHMRRGLCGDVVTLCPVPDDAWQMEVATAVLHGMVQRWRKALLQLRDDFATVAAWHIVPSFALLDAQATPDALAMLGTFEVKRRAMLRGYADDDGVTIRYIRRPFLAYGTNDGLTASAGIDPKRYRKMVESTSQLWDGLTHVSD